MRKSWFVPGKTATRRIDCWLAQEAEMLAIHGDSKGRDAFAFDPISSPYLEVSDDLRVRTPYSKTVLEELRAIPWASWDDELRAWRVPFRSYEELRRRWPRIERAAQHAEPEARKRRREVDRETEAYKAAQQRNAERRRHRYPLPAEDLPPLGRPVATEQYGIVVFNEVSGEFVEPFELTASFPIAMRLRLGPLAFGHAPRIGQDVARTQSARSGRTFEGLVATDTYRTESCSSKRPEHRTQKTKSRPQDGWLT